MSEIPERVLPQRVGFAFAKRHGVLVRRVHEGVADCVYRPGAGALAVAEVRRYLGVPVKLEKVEEATFDILLRQAYEAGNDAMEAAEGIEESTDLAHLAQDLPEQADLLESEDDAPIIRLINAVLTQAVKEMPRTSTSNRSRTASSCGSGSTVCCAKCCRASARSRRWSYRASR